MKCWVVIIFTFCIVTTSNAQLIDNYGVKLGISYSNIDHHFLQMFSDYDADYTYGWSFSIYAKQRIIENIILISEIGYIQKGYQDDFIRSNQFGEKLGKFTVRERFDYLSIKLVPTYEHSFKSFSPYIFIGPKIDIKMILDNDHSDLIEKINKTQLGLTYGAGLKVSKIIPYALLIEINSNYDFDYIFKNNFAEIRNISYELKIGVEF